MHAAHHLSTGVDLIPRLSLYRYASLAQRGEISRHSAMELGLKQGILDVRWMLSALPQGLGLPGVSVGGVTDSVSSAPCCL